jgi:hypothetical protein
MPGVPALAVLITLTGAAAAQPATPGTPAPAEKVICVRGQAETGSHFGASKVCHTESEWAMIRSQSAHTMERFDTQTRQQAPAGGH